jgi:hypothetical protein
MKNFLYIVAGALALSLADTSVLTLSQTISASFQILRKEVRFDRTEVPARINLRLDGITPSDLITLRSKGNDLKIAAGSYQGKRSFDPRVMPNIRPLPEDSLSIDGASVVFRRPTNIPSVVFLDIQVPDNAHVHLVINGRTVVDSRLNTPISLRNDMIGLGSKGVSGTLVQAMLPDDPEVIPPVSPDQPYGVAFSRLKVRKMVSPDLKPGEVVKVVLAIDTDGRVVSVAPLIPKEIDPELKQTLQQWEFEPFIVKGQAVRVITTVDLKR